MEQLKHVVLGNRIYLWFYDGGAGNSLSSELCCMILYENWYWMTSLPVNPLNLLFSSVILKRVFCFS